jgi:hypothetical protein
MGSVFDLKSRLENVRKYVGNKIVQAREQIYRLGKPISGAAVEGLLKATSLVPTVVCFACSMCSSIKLNLQQYRMPSRIG